MNENIPPERLYLAKGGNGDIYVDNRNLKQHQIDGIRFLYLQYKKKKAGVILNDPSGYGKTIQVVSFLSALRHHVDKPVLILCREDDIQHWMNQLQQWTDFVDDVIIESVNPFSKKVSVYVNGMMNLNLFCRRQWSTVIVDDGVPTKDVLRVEFKADYKIWITALDMKQNLNTFFTLHDWLRPKEKLDIRGLIKNTKDALTKSLLLDSVMEDFVIRRKDVTTLFEMTETQPRVTRKNKDVTRTKIKRSKRIIEETNIPKTDNVLTNSNNHTTEETVNSVNNVATNRLECGISKGNAEKLININIIENSEPHKSERSNDSSASHDENIIGNEVISEEKAVKYKNMNNHTENEDIKKEIVNNTRTSIELDHRNVIDIEVNLEKNRNCEKRAKPSIQMDIVKNVEKENEITEMQIKEITADNNTYEIDKSSPTTIEKDLKNETDIKLNLEKSRNCEKREIPSIESKIKEMEEVALKKFKGSFLDRLF